MAIKRCINNIHDKSYKDILSNKEVFVELLSTFINTEWVKNLKTNELALINKEFVLADYKDIESDIVYKVNDGEKEVYFYVLMELKSTVDCSMPARLFLYMCEVYRDIIKNIDKHTINSKDFKLPAVIPIVLYNGEYNWNSEKEFENIIYKSNEFGSDIINFEYLLLDVDRYKKEELLKLGNVCAAIFMLEQKVDYIEFLSRLKDIAINFNTLTSDEKVLLKHWLRNILDGEFKEKYKIADILNVSKDQVVKMTSNISKTLREGYEKSKIKGMEYCIQQGEDEGVKLVRSIVKLSTQAKYISNIANI